MWQMLAFEIKITSCLIKAFYADFQIFPETWLLDVNTIFGHTFLVEELEVFLWLPRCRVSLSQDPTEGM